jgi:peptide/nickel transport system ATP-binding protein
VSAPLLEARNLARHFRGRGGVPALKAVDGVSFTIAEGSTLGIAGESGSGKSTLARLVMALDRPTAGEVVFAGQDLFAQPPQALARLRRGFQMVFQDPYDSLDPRMSVGRIVAEPLHLEPSAPRGTARRQRVAEVLSEVGLAPSDAERRPHQFSGGQRQRIAIARALISRPRLVVADEPVSALDLSVQAQVLNLLMDLRDREGLAFLFISHNLAVMQILADRIAVMYRGRFVETGPAEEIFRRPMHPYTRLLLASEPRIDAPRRRAKGPDRRAASPATVESGAADWARACAFAPRCPHATMDCRTITPKTTALAADHQVTCHYAGTI